MFELKPREHPLKTLREAAGLSQTEVSKLTGVSATRISLCENRLLDLDAAEEESIRKSIVGASKQRHAMVLHDADPRFQEAMRRITANAGHKKLFEHLRESVGYSELEAAVFVLNRDYPR